MHHRYENTLRAQRIVFLVSYAICERIRRKAFGRKYVGMGHLTNATEIIYTLGDKITYFNKDNIAEAFVSISHADRKLSEIFEEA